MAFLGRSRSMALSTIRFLMKTSFRIPNSHKLLFQKSDIPRPVERNYSMQNRCSLKLTESNNDNIFRKVISNPSIHFINCFSKSMPRRLCHQNQKEPKLTSKYVKNSLFPLIFVLILVACFSTLMGSLFNP